MPVTLSNMKTRDSLLLEKAYEQVRDFEMIQHASTEMRAFLLLMKFAMSDPIIQHYLKKFVPKIKHIEGSTDYNVLTPQEEIELEELKRKIKLGGAPDEVRLRMIELTRKLNSATTPDRQETVSISEEEGLKYKNLILRRVKALNADSSLMQQIEDIVDFMIDSAKDNPDALLDVIDSDLPPFMETDVDLDTQAQDSDLDGQTQIDREEEDSLSADEDHEEFPTSSGTKGAANIVKTGIQFLRAAGSTTADQLANSLQKLKAPQALALINGKNPKRT